MTTLILGKNARGEAIVLGVEKTETLAHEFAKEVAKTGRVSEAYCVEVSLMVSASEVARENPEGTKPAEDTGVSGQGVNAADTGQVQNTPTSAPAKPKADAKSA